MPEICSAYPFVANENALVVNMVVSFTGSVFFKGQSRSIFCPFGPVTCQIIGLLEEVLSYVAKGLPPKLTSSPLSVLEIVAG